MQRQCAPWDGLQPNFAAALMGAGLDPLTAIPREGLAAEICEWEAIIECAAVSIGDARECPPRRLFY